MRALELEIEQITEDDVTYGKDRDQLLLPDDELIATLEGESISAFAGGQAPLDGHLAGEQSFYLWVETDNNLQP
mgnify:CR=1 FL=1